MQGLPKDVVPASEMEGELYAALKLVMDNLVVGVDVRYADISQRAAAERVEAKRIARMTMAKFLEARMAKTMPSYGEYA